MAGEQALFLFFMRQMLLFFFSRMYLRRRALRRRERYHEIQRAAIFAVIAIIQAQGGIDRSVWERDSTRSTHWWNNVVFDPAFDDQEWYRRFRMTKATFLRICDDLEPHLARKNTRMRDAIPVTHRVAVAIYWLASGDLFRTVADLFGLSTPSVSNIVHDFCQVVVENLLPRYLSWPKGETLRQIVHGFEQRWDFPQCAGAVDGTHVEVKAPSESPTDYFNRKGYHSMVLQAVVDFCYRRCWGGMVVLEEFAESCPFEAVAAPCVVKTLCYRKLRVSGHVMLAGEIPRYDPDWPYQHNYTTQ
ncbi:hypothetical protein Bbelb_317930 [Branchiostoma belcheri]|nr:hypothetical protein Bbelb_317930 [Branchiostoma belcheri]